MILNYSSQQMLQTWRRCAGLEPVGSACSVQRFDGIDIDSRLTEMMRQWMLGLLDNGDFRLLGPPADATPMINVSVSGYSADIVADPAVRRLCTIRLSGWQREADVVDEATIVSVLALQANPFARGGTSSPIAWRDKSGIVHAIPADGSSTVVSAKAYIDAGPDVYRIDERALATINQFINNHLNNLPI